MGNYYIVDTRSSDQPPINSPTGGYFEYGGIPTEETADITAEALYDQQGQLRATRHQWRIRRILQPDPYHIDRVLGRHYPSASPPVAGLLWRSLRLLVTLLGVVVGAAIGAVVGAILGGAPGMLLGAAGGGWLGGAIGTAAVAG
jgi:hypothetical protein